LGWVGLGLVMCY